MGDREWEVGWEVQADSWVHGLELPSPPKFIFILRVQLYSQAHPRMGMGPLTSKPVPSEDILGLSPEGEVAH